MTLRALEFFFTSGVIFTVLFSSCTKDKLPEPQVNSACDTLMPVYIGTIKPIIDSKCAIPGCHSAGSSAGDFTTYESMLPRLDNGRFKKRTLDQRDMPPQGSEPLTEEELLLIECWINAGFPKQ